MANPSLKFSQAVEMIGTTGIRRLGNMIVEEFLPELQGRQGRAKYREMSANDPTIRRGLRAMMKDLLRPKWTVEGGEGPGAEKAREFLGTCMDDMSHTWGEGLPEALAAIGVSTGGGGGAIDMAATRTPEDAGGTRAQGNVAFSRRPEREETLR